MKQQTGKWLRFASVLMLLAVAGITMFPQEIAAAGKEANPAFERQIAAELLEQKQFTVNDEAVKMKEDDTAGGVKISAPAENLSNAVFQLGSSFDFGTESADYLVIDALAERKKKMQLAFYLDDATDPFVTVTPARQRKKDDWSVSKNRCVSLADAGITGSHRLSFRVVLPEGETDKLKLLFRSVTFMKNDIPMIDFSIDESMGSIAEMNGDVEHNTECYGNMTLRIPEGYQSEYSNEKYETQTYELDYIRGRGNSTWASDKKPYKVKLDKKQDLLGMGANKHWVLLANYYDITMLRNKLTYWLGAELGMEFTPQCVFVDVVMNGEYLGSYYLCEQIRVGKSRVDIDDLEENEETMQSTDPDIISGGYLLGIAPYGDETGVTFSTKQGLELLIESPSFEDYQNEAQAEYIENYVQQTEDAIYGKDFQDKNGKSYADYMDVAAAIDYFWIQEFSMNGDAFGSTSTYLYKKRNGKLYWGPLWDFDYVAWGATEYDENQVSGFTQNDSAWFGRLLQDPEFCKQVKERWPAIRKKLLEAAEDGGQIDKYSEQQYESQKHNYEIWEPYSENSWWDYIWNAGYGNESISENEVSYDGEVERFKSWIQERVAWIDENLDDIQGKYYSVKFMVDEEEYATLYTKEDDILEGFPQEPVKDGYYFDGWYVTIEEDGDSYEYELTPNSTIYSDLVAKAKWTKDSGSSTQVSEIAFMSDEYYVVGDEEFTLPYCTLPFNAKHTSILWESDDTSVVEVMPDGSLYAVDAGEATVTLTAENGVTAGCKVHVLGWDELNPENLKDQVAKVKFTSKTETVEKGSYKKLPFRIIPENAILYDTILFASSDESVIKVNECGYISGEKAGTAMVIVYNAYDGKMECCTVTVTDSSKKNPSQTVKPVPTQKPGNSGNQQQKTLEKGAKFTHRGLVYQVVSTKKGRCQVCCISVKNKKCKKVNIPDSITYQKQKYSVTSIARKCFANCKKLKKVTLGKNVKKVNAGAFQGCKKIKEIYINSTKASRVKKLQKQIKKVLKKNAKKVKIYVKK